MIKAYSHEVLEEASELLSRGELVAFPVEHGYAVACEPFDFDAVQSLQRVRGAEGVALPLFIGYRTALDGVTSGVDPAVRQLLIGAWPGLLTLVLPSAVPWNLGAGVGGYLSVRQPLDPIALALAQLHGPIATTAGAKVGEKSMTAQEVDAALNPALTIDGGPRLDGLPSTLIQCNGSRVAIVREGALSAEEIKRLGPDLTLVEPDALG